MVIADVNVGILFVFAIASLGVYGIVIGGWASNSKYPFLGGIRSSAQMLSYELSLGACWATDNDRRSGAYGRISLLYRPFNEAREPAVY